MQAKAWCAVLIPYRILSGNMVHTSVLTLRHKGLWSLGALHMVGWPVTGQYSLVQQTMCQSLVPNPKYFGLGHHQLYCLKGRSWTPSSEWVWLQIEPWPIFPFFSSYSQSSLSPLFQYKLVSNIQNNIS